MGRPRSRVAAFFWDFESVVASVSLLLLGVLPVLEVVVRFLYSGGIPAYNRYLLHLVLVVSFLGGMIAARDGRHLSIRVAVDALPDRLRLAADSLGSVLTVTIVVAFFWSSLSFVAIGFEPGSRVGLFATWLVAAVMPLAFAVIGVRFLLAGPGGAARAVAAAVGVIVGTVIGLSAIASMVYTHAAVIPPIIDRLYDFWFVAMRVAAVPLAILLVVAAFIGVPLFVVLGGVALLLFARDGGSIEVIANESYVMLTGNAIPAIPLFTLAGFFLSESKAGERLVRLFRALFGWLPGGLFIAAILASTFFTTFTGASGVTILALGGLLLFVLNRDPARDQGFAVGTLTASGSIGLLFPPSLALIVYGSVAGVSIFDLFLGGVLPGALLVIAMCVAGVVFALKHKVPSVPFSLPEAWSALKGSIWEVLLPAIVVAVYFSGIATLVETAALAVVYTLFVETVIHREIGLRRLVSVSLQALTIVGGVLLIVALARGLSYYIIDVQIPEMLTSWVAGSIGSRFVFLLLVNLALLIAGMFMDIFGAILVVAPLIIPLGAAFGVDPVHLGIIFVANMGVGFITPPVGLNLFLASYRFELPLAKVYRAVAPFFLLQLLIVLVITYWPWLSTVLL
ncbi:MAG: TRAP transporter large permease subunit [Spirochaetaceae bacterium]|nr:MAG: TRAP transporter large permease subunit [Spirochaetaceae bacterium]